MIANISYTQSSLGALKYNFEKVHQANACILYCNNMLEDLNFGLAEEHAIQWLGRYEKLSFGIAKPAFHLTLNPHPNDSMGQKKSQILVRDFMKELGMLDQPYVVFKHADLLREHFHIVGCRRAVYTHKFAKYNDQFYLNEICKEFIEKYTLSGLPT
ncbi:relaxase/mobilization nuclease domain-containing protein [Myroides sp. LJL115]